MYRNGTMDVKDQETNGYAFMKTSCMHCGDPSCVSACPVSAMTKDPVTGVVGYNALTRANRVTRDQPLELGPGAPLVETRIAQELGTSQAPV